MHVVRKLLALCEAKLTVALQILHSRLLVSSLAISASRLKTPEVANAMEDLLATTQISGPNDSANGRNSRTGCAARPTFANSVFH